MPIYPLPSSGTDKHHGKALAYVLMPAIFASGNSYGYADSPHTTKLYGWSSVSRSGSVDVRENTNSGSKMKQYQVMREDTPSAEVTFYLPYNEDDTTKGAKFALRFIRAGVLIDDTFNVLDTAGNSLFDSDYQHQFGRWIVQSSSISISRDELTTVKATIKALGYSGASVDWS